MNAIQERNRVILIDLWTKATESIGINPNTQLSLPEAEYEEDVRLIDMGHDYE